jgi:hypothetical protein
LNCIDARGAVRKMSGFSVLCLAKGVDPAEVSIGEAGYAREARATYRERGKLPHDARSGCA